MPEGDTVWRTAHRLHEVFAGQELTVCDLRWPGLSTFDLTGRRTREVVPRGKHLLHRLDDGWTLHSHLRMEGSWRIERQPAARPRGAKVRAVLGTDAYLVVGWSLGMLDVVRSVDEVTLVGHLGPDLLGPDWDADVALGRVRAHDGSLASALLDQRNLAGLGTMWASEAMFAARLDPFAPAASVPEGVLGAMLERVRARMRGSCASSLPSSAVTAHGAVTTSVHGRRHKPCRRCGTLVAMRFDGPPTRQRTIYYCPACQGVAQGMEA